MEMACACCVRREWHGWLVLRCRSQLTQTLVPVVRTEVSCTHGTGAFCSDRSATHSPLNPEDETCPVFVAFYIAPPMPCEARLRGALGFTYRKWFPSSVCFEAMVPSPCSVLGSPVIVCEAGLVLYPGQMAWTFWGLGKGQSSWCLLGERWHMNVGHLKCPFGFI